MELRDAIRQNPMTRFQWSVVGICIMLTVIDGYEILVTSFTLPALTKEWGLSLSQAGLVASIGTLGMGIGAVLFGPMGDRFGRRRHILVSLVLIVVGMVASGLAPTFTLFLLFRFLAGMFLGGIVPSINVLVSEYASDAKRGTVMGIYGIGFPLGAAMGGFLSIWLIHHFGWHGPFLFSATVTALLAVVAYFTLPESVSYLVEKRPRNATATYNRIGARLGLGSGHELPEPTSHIIKPSIGKDMWRGVMLKRTLLLFISYALLIAAFYFANSFTAKLVAASTGDDTIGITAQALVAAGGVAGALLFAVFSLRLHPRIVTALVMFIGTAAFFLFGTSFHHTGLVLVLAVLVGLAANGGVAAYYAISPPVYPTAIRASAVGLMMGFGRVIAFLAPNIAAFMLSHGLTPPDVYIVYAVVLAVAGVAVIALHRTYRGDNSLDAMELESRVGLELDADTAKPRVESA
ncbi:MFS transporter [Gordonia sp. NPDC003424]